MSLRVAIICTDTSNIWVLDVIEGWSRPLPRKEELLLIIPSDFAAADRSEPVVENIYWPVKPTDKVDVFVEITTPFGAEEDQVRWLAEHGFRELETDENFEEFTGLPGLAELMAD